MPRRVLTVLSAFAVAAGTMVATAPSAAAATCNTTTGGALNGTTLCYASATLGTMSVPYSVGSICVAGTCTPALSDTLDVPTVKTLPIVYGTVCVTYKAFSECVPYTTALDLRPE